MLPGPSPKSLQSHVKPTVLGWNGTSASWLGLERDRALIDVIKKRTGCRVVTSTLSIIQALKELNISRIGLVTPYVTSIQNKIINNFELEKLECVSERHFNMTDNFSFGEVSESKIANAAEDVISEGAEAVIILCTNLAGAGIVSTLEKRTGVPILDSIVLTIWGAFRSIGLNTNPLSSWGPAIWPRLCRTNCARPPRRVHLGLAGRQLPLGSFCGGVRGGPRDAVAW